MRRVYKQGYATKREVSQTTWVLHLSTGEIVGTCCRAGRKYGNCWHVSPTGRVPSHRLFADTLGEAIEKATSYMVIR